MLWGIIFVPSSDKLCLWGGISDSLSGTLSHISSLLLSLLSWWGVYLSTSSVSNELSLTTWMSKDLSSWHWQFHIGGISEHFICFEWALIDNMDQQRTLLLVLAVSYRGYIGRTSSENLNSFWVWLLLHRGLFYEIPIMSIYDLIWIHQLVISAFHCVISFGGTLIGFCM